MESNPEEIQEILQEMSFASKALTREITEICWYMRGSIQWDQAWNLTAKNREVITKLIKENIERTEKTKLPLI